MIYQDINAIFTKADGGFSAAEAHGMATGILCVNVDADAKFWLQEIQEDSDGFNHNDLATMENLFEELRNTLLNETFIFQPLLPGDMVAFDEQIDALRSWCQGFLYGIGSVSPTNNWPVEINEIVKDITEYTKLEANAEDEDAENDLMELTEYLRASVIFLHSELNSANNNTVH